MQIEKVKINQCPLAARMKPRSLAEFVGQAHVLGEGQLLKRAITSKRVNSIILCGPAGCGKTSLGFIVAKELEAEFEYLSAAFSSVSEVKKTIVKAKHKLESKEKRTLIFIDEIHRFSKLQQESLVPDTEVGTIILVGATIYNPFYYLIPSLISRSIVAKFKPLSNSEIVTIIKRALTDKQRGLGDLEIEIANEALDYIVEVAGGDARSALGAIEVAALSTEADSSGKIVINFEVAKESIQKKILYDRKDNYHYDTISAFIKSVRGSDVDSALYWLAKMLKAGEDPRFIARRLVILASEDIGNANSFALVLATSCFKAVELVGMPESNLILAQTTIYLAAAPKSNSVYLAIQRAESAVEEEQTEEVPEHLKTHSKDYKYPHSFGGYVEQDYGAKAKFYFPKDIGEEKKVKEFLRNLKA